MSEEQACKHELCCRKCGESIGHIGMAAADADPEFDAELDNISEEIGKQLVSSVRCHTEGAHERVNVWIRGGHAGALLVGADEAQPLRRLLLSEDIVVKARHLIRLWKMQDGFNSSDVDDLMCAIDATDRLARLTDEGVAL